MSVFIIDDVAFVVGLSLGAWILGKGLCSGLYRIADALDDLTDAAVSRVPDDEEDEEPFCKDIDDEYDREPERRPGS